VDNFLGLCSFLFICAKQWCFSLHSVLFYHVYLVYIQNLLKNIKNVFFCFKILAHHNRMLRILHLGSVKFFWRKFNLLRRWYHLMVWKCYKDPINWPTLDQTFRDTNEEYVICKYHTVNHLTFWLSLLLSPKFRLETEEWSSAQKWSHFLFTLRDRSVWSLVSQQSLSSWRRPSSDWAVAESKVNLNSPVDFACTRC